MVSKAQKGPWSQKTHGLKSPKRPMVLKAHKGPWSQKPTKAHGLKRPMVSKAAAVALDGTRFRRCALVAVLTEVSPWLITTVMFMFGHAQHAASK